MTAWRDRLALLSAALWWGSLTAIGFMAVPQLFAHAPSAALAGQLAAKLFAAQTWLSLGCGMLLLVWVRVTERNALIGWIAGGLLLSLLVQFGVAPRIVARQDLALWHSLGTAMYAAQWACALVVLAGVPLRSTPAYEAPSSPP